MKIKLFVFASIVYMIVLGAFIFTINNENYTLNLGSYSLELPVVIWFLLPVFILFVVALVHMSFYGFLRYLRYKHFFDDADEFESFVNALLLQKPTRSTFKTKEFKRVAELSQSLKTHKKLANAPKLNEIIDILNELEEGKGVNLKKFKLENDNPLNVQNEKNRLKNDLNYAYARIKNKKEFEDDNDELAFDEVLKNGSKEQIFNLKLPKNNKAVFTLMQRFENDSLNLSPSEYESVINGVSFEEKEYVKLAKMSIKKLNPDALIAIFKRLKNTHIEALRAYLFILADLSLFDELRLEIAHDKKGFNDFKLVLLAREKNIKINLFDFIQ